jgi:hypothetical protein
MYPCEMKQLLLREREEYDKYDIDKMLNSYCPKVTKQEINNDFDGIRS